jgi:hypothetical protein
MEGSAFPNPWQCPPDVELLDRGPSPMECAYQPRGRTLPPVADRRGGSIGNTTAAQRAFLASASSDGEWHCKSNAWRPRGLELYHISQQNVSTTSAVDAIVTWGDSTTKNICTYRSHALPNAPSLTVFCHVRTDTGLSVVATGYEASTFSSDRHDTMTDPSARPAALPVAHFCCGQCKCGKSSDEAARDLFAWAERNRARTLLLVIRSSLHIYNNVGLMTEDVVKVLDHADEYDGEVTVLWIPPHGAGRRKLKKFLSPKFSQGTEPLIAYDVAVRATVEKHRSALAHASTGAGKGGKRGRVGRHGFLELDIRRMFEAAETSCWGAYESPDGTHLSASVLLNAAVLIFRLAALL